MAEWSKAHISKTCLHEDVTCVQITVSPPYNGIKASFSINPLYTTPIPLTRRLTQKGENMVREKMISCSDLKIVAASKNFVAKYFKDEIVSLNIHSSQTSKQRTDKEYYEICFCHRGGDDKVPPFLELEDYANQFKKEFSEWLGKEVKYFHLDWSLAIDDSNKEKTGTDFCFDFSIELRI